MSESSLDSELLAVAGAKKSAKKRGRKALSESEEEEVSSEDVSLDDESDWETTKASSKKRAGGSASKPARKRRTRGRAAAAESSEEGEDAHAAVSDESSDEDRLEIDEEELIEDEEDRKRLAAMTELQREYELANRAEKRNTDMLRQKLLTKSDANSERAGAKAAKRVGRVKFGREEREEAAKKSAMEELKAARERKARGAEERARKRDGSEELDDEEEEDDDEEGERRRARRREEEREDGMLDSEDDLSDEDRRHDLYGRRGFEDGADEEDEAPEEDVKKIQVRRVRLEEWVNEPFFEDTLPGCMVRVVAGDGAPGPDGMTNRRYMLCQVVAVEERPPGIYKDSGQPWRSPYAFGPNQEKIHKWLLVERGNSQRGMPLAQVSNQGFTQAEFESWQRALKEQHRPQVSRRTVTETHERLVAATTYRYTAEDVSRLLEQKKAKGQAPRNIAVERAWLEAQLAFARENGEEEKVAILEAQMAMLEAGQGEGMMARRGQSGMVDLNKRNAAKNFQNAFDNVSNKPGVAAGVQDNTSSELDPFSRRATRPKIYWSTKRQQDDEDPQEPDAVANGDAAAAQAAAAAAQQQQEQQQRKADADAVVDLSNLDLSILDRPPRMTPMARKLLGPTWQPPVAPSGAHIMTLEEYYRSKGWA